MQMNARTKLATAGALMAVAAVGVSGTLGASPARPARPAAAPATQTAAPVTAGRATAPVSSLQQNGPLVAAQAAGPERIIIRVKTGDYSGAGTDATIHVRVHGSRSSTTFLNLDNSDDNHERGDTDQYSFIVSDLGTLRSVDVRFVPGGNYPEWYLDYVTVTADNLTVWFLRYGWFYGTETRNLPRA
jgi:hypothetical protein